MFTIELAPGYHLIDMYRTQTDLFAILKVEWRYGDESWELLDGSTLQMYTRAPSYVQYNPISTLVNTYVNNSSPIVHYSGGHYTVKPNLPAGMWLDDATGAIHGQSSVAVYGEYVITAENEYGTSKASLTILVGNEPIPGLMGHYYRVQEEKNVCDNRLFYTYYAVHMLFVKKQYSCVHYNLDMVGGPMFLLSFSKVRHTLNGLACSKRMSLVIGDSVSRKQTVLNY